MGCCSHGQRALPSPQPERLQVSAIRGSDGASAHGRTNDDPPLLSPEVTESQAPPIRMSRQMIDPLHVTNIEGSQALAFCFLSFKLSPEQRAILPTGATANAQKLLLQAAYLAPESPWVLWSLAAGKTLEEVVEFPGKGPTTVSELYTQAEMKAAESYNGRRRKAHHSSITIHGFVETCTSVHVYVKLLTAAAIQAYPTICYMIGSSLQVDETASLPTGEVLGERGIYLKAIELNCMYAPAHNNLGLTLSLYERIQLPNGEILDRRGLYLKAIELDWQFVNAYINLGGSLSPDESIQLSSGEVLDERGLYIKVIGIDGKSACAYSNLGLSLSHDESIQLPSGVVLDKKGLFLKAIEVDSTFAMAYSNLSGCCRLGENIQLPSGENLDKIGLCLKAISVDGTCAWPYSNLGAALSPDASIQLPSGEFMSKKDFCLKAIELDDTCAMAYSNLGACFRPDETILLPSGETLGRRGLFFKANIASKYTKAPFSCEVWC